MVGPGPTLLFLFVIRFLILFRLFLLLLALFLQTQDAFEQHLVEVPSETRVLLKCKLEQLHVDRLVMARGVVALEESAQQLFVGEDQELMQLIVAGLLEILRQEQESVLVRFQHLLVFGLSIHNININVWRGN